MNEPALIEKMQHQEEDPEFGTMGSHLRRGTYLKVVSIGTSNAGLPKTFIMRPCLPLDAKTLKRDRNILKNPT